MRLLRVALLTVLVASATGTAQSAVRPMNSLPQAGTRVVNTASVAYQDTSGQSYSTQSNAVITAFAPVGALVVTPKQAQANPASDSFAIGANVTRTFTITNVSNIDDAYTVAKIGAAPGKVVSVAFVTPGGTLPATIGTTASPSIHPGESIGVQVVIATTGVALGTAFPITMTAQTTGGGTTNGLQSDTGEQWALTATAPHFTGVNGPNAQIVKTVDRAAIVQSNPGATVTFDIAAKNSGGSAATNVILTDAVPNGLQPDVTSVSIGGAPAGPSAKLSGQTLTVTIPSLAAGALADISFNATVINAAIAGATFTNVATLAADGVPPQGTTPASVLVGTANVVFDPATNNHPVAGAVITLLDANGNPVKLPAATGALDGNVRNPFTTGADGSYTFALAPSQIAAGGSRFYLTIAAPGFLNRKIQLDIEPGTGGLLYDVTSMSLDNRPLARAGGYALTSQNVQLSDVFGLFGNIPLFTAQAITISKNVDKQVAAPGDRLVYTIAFGNPSQSPLGRTQLVDTLPAGEAYAPGTARMDGAPLEPTVNARTLTWTVSSLNAGGGHTLVYATVVFPSVAAGTTLVNAVTASTSIPGTHAYATANATADVRIVGGAFSQSSIITGRIYVDANHAGRFKNGDRGLAGVRIFLEDGSSVVTDREGRYSFAGVRPGMHVLRVDISTLPPATHPFTAARANSAWAMQRLIHGLFDDGLIEDVNFGVSAAP
ncbi:MAG: isopeptide-forming domain-containing fimbrial protein [Vulcanimicrobiaceae bacterium]